MGIWAGLLELVLEYFQTPLLFYIAMLVLYMFLGGIWFTNKFGLFEERIRLEEAVGVSL
jgi:hypothetical protein